METCCVVPPDEFTFTAPVFKLLGADEIITLKDEQVDSAFEGVEIDFFSLAGNRMIRVITEASPEELDLGVRDCGFRGSASNMPPKRFLAPV